MANDGRKYKRIKTDFNVRAIIPDDGQGYRGIKTGKTRNVSATGVLFHNDVILNIGTVINVKFLKPNSFDFFESPARVVRVEIPSDGAGYEIGVQFIDLTEDDEKKLDYYLSPEEE
jgi:c-di-GMP-binding flagellar brake protein YcgR